MPFVGLSLPEQAMGWFTLSLGLELVVENKLTEFYVLKSGYQNHYHSCLYACINLPK